MNTEQNSAQDSERDEPAPQNSETPETVAPTPLRQLLHWVTGDREAEAKALAEETMSLRDKDQKGGIAPKEEALQEAVLNAAKDAVSLAHGDSMVPNELVEPSAGEEAPRATNLLEEWEDAVSFSEHPAQQPVAPTPDTDVARPSDVEAIIEAPAKP
jgi:hypothetical protein